MMSDLKSHEASNLLRVTLRFLKPKDAHQVQELCEDWFPIKYPSIWYKWITKTNKFYALAALQDSMIIGLLVAQTKPLVDINPEDQNVLLQADLNGGNIGYILTLGVRKPYRRLGLASLLLNQYIEHVRLDYHIKCQHASCIPSFLLTSTQERSHASHSSNGSVHVQQEEISCVSNVALNNLNNSATNGVNSIPAKSAASKRPLVTPASESAGSAHAPSSPGQRLAHVGSSSESYITLQFDELTSTEIPFTEIPFTEIPLSEIPISEIPLTVASCFTSVDSQPDAEMGTSFRGELMNLEQVHNGGYQNDPESLRPSSIPRQNNQANTCGPVILNINVEEVSSPQILEEPSSTQDESDARHVSISMSDSSDAADVKDKWNDLRLCVDVRPSSTLKSTSGADINSNVLTPTYSCSVPVCAAASRPHAEPRGAGGAAADVASSCGGQADHTLLSPAAGGGAAAASGACADTAAASASSHTGCSRALLTDPSSAEQVPTICSSYVVESEVTQRDVLKRLQCCSPAHTTAPVTALLLHVLSSNGPAIAFYSRSKQLAFLPMFYTINDVAQDGYSYVFYINGSRAPSSFFADPLGALTLPATSGALGSLSSVRARVAGAVARWGVGDLGSHSNIVGSVLAGVVGVFERMVATLMGADSR